MPDTSAPPPPTPSSNPSPQGGSPDLPSELRRAILGGEVRTRRIDAARYRKVRRFIVGVFLQAVWWDLILSRPLLRWARRDPLPRWQRIARRYRQLAVEMGGVLIKLGQFLSIRVDLLPSEVTRELAGLQDEVPPERFEDIVARIEEDFGRPVDEVFSHLERQPVGAASLAQVHRAHLPSGEEVVVKVLRPGIEVLVETDLAAAALAIRWLKVSKRVRRRVDLDRLAEEFMSTTRRELDLQTEADNARHFAELFADDPQVVVPAVYPDASAARTLTLENVGYLKISDRAALLATGIDPGAVARKLYRVYMEQIFVHNFVHADPHPGNLFVQPLPVAEEVAAAGEPFPPGFVPPYRPDRPFRLAFVDFGMTATIPERLRGALREYLIGLGTRDAARVVHAYASAGVLLPGADLKRIEELHEALFERFWGVSLGRMRDVALSEARYLLHQYRDLLYEAPFQVQVDLLFVSRAVGLLAGLATSLDTEFDPWAETLPFAEEAAAHELERNWRAWAAEIARQGRVLLELPAEVQSTLHRAERGLLTVQTTFAPEARRSLERLEHTGKRLSWTVAASALLVSGALLLSTRPDSLLAPALLAAAVAAFLWGTLRHR